MLTYSLTVTTAGWWSYFTFAWPCFVSSDWRVLLCGMFCLDPEGAEDGVRRGHHRDPDSQEKEGSSEAKTGATLHQLLSDHVIPEPPDHSAANHKPNLDCRQGRQTKDRTEKDKEELL